MKNAIIILFLGLITLYSNAQKSIENPEYGFASYPGELTKIEMLDTTTVLHFKLKKLPWGYFHLHKESYIQDASGDNKLFVTKVTGAKFKRNDFPSSGEAMYQLYFPPLNKTVKTIDFGVEKERGWLIYDITLQEDENSLLLPKALRGNWLLADGSNRWDYGFNSKYAIVDGMVWNYKSVDVKGKKYTIILENRDRLKTIYAKLGKDGKVTFGSSPKSLKSYSLTKVDNPNLRLLEDTTFEDITFGLDSTTYSGMIKGFSSKIKQKTFMVHVNNTFTGNQESHLVKIKDDGTFQSKFPLTHPQTVFVKMGSNAFSIFLEPNKETFHYVDRKTSLFMGDNAQVNSDLDALKEMRISIGRADRRKIGETSPEDYKKIVVNLKNKTLKALSAYQEKHFISQKALQIKNIELELGFYQELLGYDMYRGSLKYQNKKVKKETDKMPYQEFEVKDAYYDFLPKDIVDNELLVVSNSYYFFTNRLMYADIFKGQGNSRLTKVEIADGLQKNGVELTAEELNMVELSKQIETPEILAKVAKFDKKYGDVERGFYKNYKEDYFKEVQKALKEGKTPKHNHFILSVADYFKAKNIEITDEETKMVEALRVLKTPLEIEEERMFNEQFTGVFSAFYNKYNDNASEIFRARSITARNKKIKDFFGKQNSFLQNVIKMQSLSKRFEDFNVYSNAELTRLTKDIDVPFLKNYLIALNEQTKKNIEINKTKGGYTVHNVHKNEGDELFDAMLEKFKGKVVYVDFWATWCGPCKSGIKRMKPLKEEMANEDVVFLYVTNQTSPEKTWNNAIANINGEHYRVSDDEWNYLAKKFNISGIPHYTLVDRAGNVIKPKLRQMPNASLKKILLSEINK
ncbi:TlpA family protein disulfide reductase [Hyunsoonleella sp. 2307UL5-6]|uniref:TlpA family protein disulfide reductase n=1 Tax=Hyunsoonleella sp. 2307UL5-6 TaxID=3384768 RepID=UPI0039BCE8D3